MIFIINICNLSIYTEFRTQLMNSEILKLIRKSRVSKEISQKDIAKKLHMSVPTYSRFESGITKTDYELVLKICNILEIDARTIFTTGNFTVNYNNEMINMSKQIKELVILLEKQNEVSALILQKLLQIERVG